MRRPCVPYVTRLSSAPLCAPVAESGSGQNNGHGKSRYTRLQEEGSREPSPSWGVFTGFPTLRFPARQSWHLGGA